MYSEGFLETVRQWDGSLLSPSGENRRIEGVRVFRSEWFERHFAKAHPIMPGIWWAPIFVYCIHTTIAAQRIGPMAMFFDFVLGFLGWTLIEYLLHRFFFHMAAGPTFQGKLRQFMVHGYHHEFPNDRMRLVAPLLLSVPIGSVVAVVYYFLIGGHHGLMTYSGTVIGYLTYDWTHYYTHHFRPTTRLGKFLRRYHMEHHYRDSESHFGISSPLWDWVFGTARSRGEAEPQLAGDSP